jgi:hypothetical protein
MRCAWLVRYVENMYWIGEDVEIDRVFMLDLLELPLGICRSRQDNALVVSVDSPWDCHEAIAVHQMQAWDVKMV